MWQIFIVVKHRKFQFNISYIKLKHVQLYHEATYGPSRFRVWPEMSNIWQASKQNRIFPSYNARVLLTSIHRRPLSAQSHSVREAPLVWSRLCIGFHAEEHLRRSKALRQIHTLQPRGQKPDVHPVCRNGSLWKNFAHERKRKTIL